MYTSNLRNFIPTEAAEKTLSEKLTACLYAPVIRTGASPRGCVEAGDWRAGLMQGLIGPLTSTLRSARGEGC